MNYSCIVCFYRFHKPFVDGNITDPYASFAEFFLSVSLGLGRTDTPEKTQRKSMSNERTFSPTEDETVLRQKLGNGCMVIHICLLLQYLTNIIQPMVVRVGDGQNKMHHSSTPICLQWNFQKIFPLTWRKKALAEEHWHSNWKHHVLR